MIALKWERLSPEWALPTWWSISGRILAWFLVIPDPQSWNLMYHECHCLNKLPESVVSSLFYWAGQGIIAENRKTDLYRFFRKFSVDFSCTQNKVSEESCERASMQRSTPFWSVWLMLGLNLPNVWCQREAVSRSASSKITYSASVPSNAWPKGSVNPNTFFMSSLYSCGLQSSIMVQ